MFKNYIIFLHINILHYIEVTKYIHRGRERGREKETKTHIYIQIYKHVYIKSVGC